MVSGSQINQKSAHGSLIAPHFALFPMKACASRPTCVEVSGASSPLSRTGDFDDDRVYVTDDGHPAFDKPGR